MQKKHIRKIIALLVCSLLLFSLTACHFPKIMKREEATEAVQPETSAAPSASETSSGLPEYYHYDPENFYNSCDVMLALYQAGKTGDAFDLFEELTEELLTIDELSSVAYVRYTEDVNNEYYNEESDYETTVYMSASDAFFCAAKAMADGEYADDFQSFLADEEYFNWIKDYEELTDEEITLSQEENDLVQEYYTLSDSLMDVSCTINGKEYHFEDVLGDNGDAFYAEDPYLYFDVYQNCLETFNEQTGQVFLKLVDIRTRIAEIHGYDNYADYADENIYFREYRKEDLEEFKELVKKYADYFADYLYVLSKDDSFSYKNTEQLLSDIGKIISGISPVADEAFSYMLNNKLYSAGDESCRIDGAYTVYLPKSRYPYCVVKTDGSSSNVITFVHEFGHFTAFHDVPMLHPLYDPGCLDLEEIHSQAFQLLFGEKAEPLFGQNTKEIQAGNVMGVISAVLDGCLMDDWQREVYENPDMTLDEINDCFGRLANEYGEGGYPGAEYLWCEISHNFENPMYYISYAISAMGALQIWDQSMDNYAAGMAFWENLIKAGPYADTYSDTMKNVGLKTFYETDAMNEVLRDTLIYIIQTYSQDYYNGI